MLILFLLLWLAIVKGEPKIEKSPVEFIQDESGSVTCTRDGFVSIANTNTTVAVCLLNLNNCNIGPESLRSVYSVSQTTNSLTIRIDKISRERDGGIWNCTGLKTMAPVTIDINVRVPVPYINIESKGSLIFRDNIMKDVKCKTGPSFPPITTVNWTIDGKIQPTSSINTVTNTEDSTTTSTLRYLPSKLHNSKTLQCTAYNGFGQSKTDSTIINVQFGVSSVEIENKDSLTFTDGDITSIKCLVGDSNPTATIRWSIENQQQSETSNIYRYTARKSNDRETLTCTANTGIGEAKSDSIILNIQYKPIVNLNPRSTSYYIIEGETKLYLQCIVDSNPTVQPGGFTWRKNNQILNGETLSILIITEPGNYRCTARNNIGEATTNTIDVQVSYGPRIKVSRESLQIKEGTTTELTCSVDSNPPPTTFLWYLKDGTTQLANRPLSISSRNQSGIYWCNATTTLISSNTSRSNDTQTNGKQVIVEVYSGPDKVTSFKVTNINEDSICVEWKPGFNGGAVQDFIVEYSTDNLTWVNSSPDTILYDDSSTNYCIRNLLSDTVYYIRIFSRNKFGSTGYIYIDDESGLIKTSALQKTNKPSGTDDRFGEGFGAGIGTSLVIFLIIIIVAVFIYRYRKRKTANNNNEHYATFNRSASANDQTYQELSVTTDSNLNQNSPNNTDRNIESQMERPYANVREGKRHYNPYINT